jgi:hypothetical protein
MNTTPAQPIYIDDRYPSELVISSTQTLQITIKRFELDEYQRFIRDFNRCSLLGKKDDLFIAQHRKETEQPVDVLARLELEQTPEERAARQQRDAEEEKFASDFIVHSLTAFVAIVPGQLYRRGSTESLTTGADLLNVYASRSDVLQAALQNIYVENCLSDDVKKKLKEQSVSGATSTPSTLAVNGDAPAPAAPRASVSDSVLLDAATAAIAEQSSGATAS